MSQQGEQLAIKKEPWELAENPPTASYIGENEKKKVLAAKSLTMSARHRRRNRRRNRAASRSF